jgi:hypothetical protein
LSKVLSASIERFMWFLSLLLFMCYIMFIDVEPSLYPCNEINLVMVYDLFDMLLNSVWQYFVEDLCIYIHKDTGL